MDDTRKTVGQGFDVPIRYKANLTIRLYIMTIVPKEAKRVAISM